MTGTASIEGAIAALRGGRAVHVDEEAFLSIETGSAATLSLVDSDRSARILVSGERAAALGLGNILDAADPSRPVVVQRDAWLDRETVIDLVDPARDLARGPFGPLRPGTVGHVEPAMAALKLSRLAGLLPALWWLDARRDGPAISATAILDALPAATIVARARLPLDNLDSVQIVAFRDSATGEEHVALIVGAFGGRPPLVRLHSECLTGDVFGSLKCDCGPQLHAALQLIAADGGGVLLYLRQEGRGIGLANKIRAYQLQDRGLDTVDANRRLGFPDDTRDYGLAAAMLRALGISAVRLLTNNPTKLEGLAAAGIRIVERVAHHMPVNPHNADYLATKRDRSGHLA